MFHWELLLLLMILLGQSRARASVSADESKAYGVTVEES